MQTQLATAGTRKQGELLTEKALKLLVLLPLSKQHNPLNSTLAASTMTSTNGATTTIGGRRSLLSTSPVLQKTSFLLKQRSATQTKDPPSDDAAEALGAAAATYAKVMLPTIAIPSKPGFCFTCIQQLSRNLFEL